MKMNIGDCRLAMQIPTMDELPGVASGLLNLSPAGGGRSIFYKHNLLPLLLLLLRSTTVPLHQFHITLRMEMKWRLAKRAALLSSKLSQLQPSLLHIAHPSHPHPARAGGRIGQILTWLGPMPGRRRRPPMACNMFQGRIARLFSAAVRGFSRG
jgi:hypothetical protein